MKTILVPTDFSVPALKALQFGLDLAVRTKSCLLVCHIYQFDLPYTGDPDYPNQEYRRIALKQLDEFLEGIDSSTRQAIDLKKILKEGNIEDELCKVIEEYEVALVVMGTTGGINSLEKFFGTTTESIMKRGLCSVIAIPKRATLKTIENIIYASDFENRDEIAMMQLLQVKELYHASLTVLNVKSEEQPDLINDGEIIQNLIKCFPGEDYNFVQIENKDVTEGIVKYTKEHNTSLLAFTILHREWWEKIFHNSVTSSLLYNLNLPMLALPETGRLLDLRNRENIAAIKTDLAMQTDDL